MVTVNTNLRYVIPGETVLQDVVDVIVAFVVVVAVVDILLFLVTVTAILPAVIGKIFCQQLSS